MGPTRILTEDEAAKRSQTVLQDKDDTEKRLEKILFGDRLGFLDSLNNNVNHEHEKALQRVESLSSGGNDGLESNEDMEDVADEDLFFLDAGAGGLPADVIQDLEEKNREEASEDDERQPLWIDSDDDRIVISLASNTRLRKLRDTEEDDVVSGREYIMRLRRQYERLHPTPDWVTEARKRNKKSMTQNSDFDTDSDVSMDDRTSSTNSVKPLAELLRTSGSLTGPSSTSAVNRDGQRRKLRPEVLDIQRVKDICGAGPSTIDNLEFHPFYPLILAAGPSSTVILYHISPDPPNPNPIVSSLHLKGTPIHTAAFSIPSLADNSSNNATQQELEQSNILLSSRRPYFHSWSLSTGKIVKVTRPVFDPAGTSKAHKSQRTTERLRPSPCGRYVALVGSSRYANSGSVNILSLPSYQWLSTCTIESGQGVADFSWWRDGNGMTVIGKNGEASEYSISERRVVLRWKDEGGVGVTTIALGGDVGQAGRSIGSDRYIAVGSQSGIVSIYDRKAWTAQLSNDARSTGTNNAIVDTSTPAAITSVFRPTPIRTFDQLTTPTSHLKFSHDGQMLVMSSRWKKNAVRLVHLPSCTVYRNWPTDKTPLGRVSAVALSRDGGYLAIANEQGKVRLWQIRD